MQSRSMMHLVFTAVTALAFAPGGLSQVPNDHCSDAIPIGAGATIGSNVGATAGPDRAGGCAAAGADVWYVFTATCNGPWAATTCGAATDFDTVLTVWDGVAGCGSLVGILCNDDFCGQPFSPAASYVTFQSVAGATYYVSVGGSGGAQGTFELRLEPIGTELNFTSNGPGTLGYTVDGGPLGGTVFTAITLNAGFFPYGWYGGIDIALGELLAEISLGFPFIVAADAVCGEAVVGPFGGLPPGLTVYGVTVGVPPGAAFPHPQFISPPQSGVVP